MRQGLKLIYLLLPLLLGCECVPDITGPKKVEPAEAANVAFINNMENVPEINIESGDFILVENLASETSSAEYNLVPAGLNNLKILRGNLELMKFAAKFEKNKFYTVIITEYGLDVKLDSSASKTAANYRISGERVEEATVNNEKAELNIINYLKSGAYPVLIKANESLLNENIDFKENHIQNIIICKSKIRIINIELTIPAKKLKLTSSANCGCDKR